MEAIKKKMQAMKVEKDNLMDRCDACEQVGDAHFLSSIERLSSTVFSFSHAVMLK